MFYFSRSFVLVVLFVTWGSTCFFKTSVVAEDDVKPPVPEKSAEASDQKPKKEKEVPMEAWFQLKTVEFDKDSPLRNDAKYNNPPNIYVNFKKNGDTLKSSTQKTGWSVSFPEDDANQILVSNNSDDNYVIEVWDSQKLKNQQLLSVSYTSASLHKILKESLIKTGETKHEIVLADKQSRSRIVFDYGGTQVWYRIKRLTIPPESQHRKALGAQPRPYILIKRNGIQLRDYSTDDWGWSVDFPKEKQNIWPIREGAGDSYSIEVWNARGSDALIFKVTGKSGKDFSHSILEDVDRVIQGSDAASILEFERTEEL